jgi:imidazole glycerol-phosphate synthase subunit HisH
VIALVDYGAGNLTSVRKAFLAVGADVRLVREAANLGAPAAIVVPGVGHFGATASLGPAWREAVLGHVESGRPLLGICLGMQWLFETSEEAPGCQGLGLLPGACVHLGKGGASYDAISRIKVPHVGWNQLERTRFSAALQGVAPGAYAYFTHSYAAPVTGDCVATTCHGLTFASVVERGSVWGTQFHPEKSGDVGLTILKNFVDGCAGRDPD